MYPKHFPIQPEDRTSCEHARRRTKIWVDEVLVLGTNDSLFTRNEILELCEALRGVTQRKMLIKYLRFAQLQGNNFNPDEVVCVCSFFEGFSITFVVCAFPCIIFCCKLILKSQHHRKGGDWKENAAAYTGVYKPFHGAG